MAVNPGIEQQFPRAPVPYSTNAGSPVRLNPQLDHPLNLNAQEMQYLNPAAAPDYAPTPRRSIWRKLLGY